MAMRQEIYKKLIILTVKDRLFHILAHICKPRRPVPDSRLGK
jgi:hypothetical protein